MEKELIISILFLRFNPSINFGDFRAIYEVYSYKYVFIFLSVNYKLPSKIIFTLHTSHTYFKWWKKRLFFLCNLYLNRCLKYIYYCKAFPELLNLRHFCVDGEKYMISVYHLIERIHKFHKLLFLRYPTWLYLYQSRVSSLSLSSSLVIHWS